MSLTETFGPLPNILILGPARHGKDTVADVLCDVTGWSFQPSSLFAAEKAVLPVLGPKYGYADVHECYEDRGDHRVEWRDLIREYNSPDKAKLAKELLQEANVYVGMRCHVEYAECERQRVFDHVLWVDAGSRIKGVDPSLTIQPDASMYVLDNSGHTSEIYEQVYRWLKSI